MPFKISTCAKRSRWFKRVETEQVTDLIIVRDRMQVHSYTLQGSKFPRVRSQTDIVKLLTRARTRNSNREQYNKGMWKYRSSEGRILTGYVSYSYKEEFVNFRKDTGP